MVKKGSKDEEGFRLDADAIVLNRGIDAIEGLAKANAYMTRSANFLDGLLRVADQVEKYLDELVGITNDVRKVGLLVEIGLDAVALQECSWSCRVRSRTLLRSSNFFCGEADAKIRASSGQCGRRGEPGGESFPTGVSWHRRFPGGRAEAR